MNPGLTLISTKSLTMDIKAILLSALVLAAPAALSAANATKIFPGEKWNDTSGKHINAHGCCVVFHDGKYYWFGEDRTKSTSNGISCYSSTDLYNWKRIGIVFKASDAYDPETKKCILERPKVVYNEKTGKWVMHIHWENGNGYGQARICVATADAVDGEYKFVSTYRPNDKDSRDQTLFKDADGKAYHFGSTNMNTNMHVALMAPDYLVTETNPVTETLILKGLRYEAPAIFRVGDTYFGVFSGCTGWDPNPGHSAMTTEILGHWEPGRNFAIDNGAATTYQSQSTYVLKVEGYEGAYIYMGDRWNKSDVGGKSEYVWLPLSVRSGSPTVKWYDSWTLDVFKDCDRFKRPAELADGMVVRLLDKYSDRWMSTKGNGFYIDNDNDATNIDFRLEATGNPYNWHIVEVKSGKRLSSVYGALMLQEADDTANQTWRFELQEDGCYRLQSVSDGKFLSVSGGAQVVNTPIFMARDGASESQSFGVYFDTRKYDYETAEMFSAGYRKANLKRIEEQKAYESSGIGEIFAEDGLSVWLNGRDLGIYSAEEGVATVRIYDAGGRLAHESSVMLDRGDTSVALPELNAGVYVAVVETGTARATAKIALR